MIWLSGLAKDAEEGLKKATTALESGRAWEMFERLCNAQGGNPNELPLATTKIDVLAPGDGFLSGYDTERIGVAALSLGAGRSKATDEVDHTAGIEIHRKLADPVKKGERLFTLYASGPKLTPESPLFKNATGMLLSATTISLQKPHVPALLTKRKVN